MDALVDLINPVILLLNFVIVPSLAYGSQLALGALGITLIYGILRFANFAHGDTMAFGTMITILMTWWLQSKGISFGFLPTALLALPIGIFATIIIYFQNKHKAKKYRNWCFETANPKITTGSENLTS